MQQALPERETDLEKRVLATHRRAAVGASRCRKHRRGCGVVDENGRIVSVNPAFTAITGLYGQGSHRT